MKTEIINCDCCGKVIAGGTWEDAPGRVIFDFGHPEQNYVTTKLDHVCYSCRQFLKQTINAALKSRAPVSSPPTPATPSAESPT